MFEITVGVLLLTLIVWFVLKIQKNGKFMKNIPASNHYPILGIAVDFLGNTENILPVLQSYINTFGPMVKVYVRPATFGLLATDEKFLEHVLSSNKLIDKAKPYEYLNNWLGSGLLTSTGDKWKMHRRILTPSFHFAILENFIEIFENNGDILIQRLEAEIPKNSFNIYPPINLCALDIICESAMGTSINAQKVETSDYVKSVKLMSKIAMERTILPLPNYIYPLTPNYYREKKLLKIIHSHANEVIDRKTNELKLINNGNAGGRIGMEADKSKKKKFAFLDMLLNTTLNGVPLSHREIREEVDTFMFAGHDTVSAALSFTIFEIAKNPDVQEKLLEEQKRIFGDLKSAMPKMAHLNDMKYLELVIFESLRLYPPVCFLGRQLKEDHEWNGHLFPKDLNLIFLTYDNMRNPKYFPEPLKFKPERFQNKANLNPYVYIPFSAGPRNCIGRKFAMLEMKSVISKIIRNYELHPANPVHNLKLVPDIVLMSKNGVCISIKNRKYFFVFFLYEQYIGYE